MFPTSCSRRCEPVWTFGSSQSSPTVANGVLYLSGSGTPGDQAFDASCGAGGGGNSCGPLWTMPPDDGGSVNFPTITSDGVYLNGTDENLRVFRLGGSATCCVATSELTARPGRSFGYPLFYGSLVGAVVWLVLRRRRHVERNG